MTWYKTGTVAVAPGGNAVIGTGTAFIRNARVGDAFRGPDGEWYEVTNIASDTALSIAPGYKGAEVAAGVYSLAPMQGYVKDSADALRAATQVIASGVADMQEQVAAATEAAESAVQSKTQATEQAGIATAAAEASTDNKDASQLAAQQSGTSAQASGESAVRAETARDSIIQSEQAAAASAAAAEDSADRAEEVTQGKAASGANNDITSLRAITSEGFDLLRQGIAPMVGATANNAGKKGLAPAGAAGDQDKFLTGGGVYKEVGGGLPVGSLTQWKYSRATIPGGQLPCDGQIVTSGRTLYPDLWALIQPFCVTDAVWLAAPYTSRGMFSLGNGATDFRMPDDNAKHADGNTISAMVFRGDGKNSAGTAGLHQADQVQGMKFKTAQASSTSGSFGAYTADTATTAGLGTNAGIATLYSVHTGAPITDGVNGAPRVGAETRGASTTGVWCIVAAKVAVNPGAVDVTVLANTVNQQGLSIVQSAASIADIQSKQVLTKRWTSAGLSWTQGGTLTPMHTLGVVPQFGILKLRYKVAANGMAVGQEEYISSTITTVSGQGNFGCSLRKPTTTSVEIVTAGTGIFGATAAGAAIQVTPTQADLILELYA